MSGWDILYFNNISYIEIRQLNRLRPGNNPWGVIGVVKAHRPKHRKRFIEC